MLCNSVRTVQVPEDVPYMRGGIRALGVGSRQSTPRAQRGAALRVHISQTDWPRMPLIAIEVRRMSARRAPETVCEGFRWETAGLAAARIPIRPYTDNAQLREARGIDFIVIGWYDGECGDLPAA